MQDSRETPQKRRRVTVFRLIMLLLLASGCAFAIFRLSLRLKLNARIEAIRAAGYPVTCAELDDWYSIPKGAENAANAITEAYSHYVERHYTQFVPLVGPVELPAKTESLDEETKAFIAMYLDDNAQTLELLHTGTAIENCRYPRDLAAGFQTQLTDLSSLRKCVRLLSIESISHIDNDPNLSVRSIISGLGLAGSLGKEPIIISQLVRIASQSLILSTLERLLTRISLTDGQLGELNHALIGGDDPWALSRGIVGDRCLGLAMLRMSPATQARTYLSSWHFRDSVHLRTLVLTLHRFTGLSDRNTIEYLDFMEDLVKLARPPLNRREKVFETVQAMCDEVSETNFLLHDLVAGLSRFHTVNLRGTAHLEAAQAAIAVQRYRLAAGKFPEKLADLVPEYLEKVPTDPFDGKELRYKKLEPGFVVYSVGEDLSDDGGRERPSKTVKDGKPVKWDVTFVVER